MNNPSTELVFPPRLIYGLRDARDPYWVELVDRVAALDPGDIKRIAFELLIARWSGCANCQADSFRAMQGCTQCAAQAVRRYRGNDTELQRLFTDGVQEIEAYLKSIE